jgi:predicted MFS family arabinose efflux permease
MIQRQQSLWLLLAAVASFLSFKFPFYTGNILENNITRFEELEGGSNFFLLVLTGASVLISAITIFLYKDRKTQLKLAIGGILIAIILLILYFVQLKKFTNGNFALTAIFVLAILIGYIMAARGIWKDEKLVKSLDKLR